MNMKFIKGMVIGSLLSCGATMWWTEQMGYNKKKMIKIGKQFAKKMGIM